MGKFYKLVIIALSFIFISNIYSQKVIRYKITNVNTNKGSDCDGTLNDSDFTWWFDGGPDGDKCFGNAGNNGAIN